MDGDTKVFELTIDDIEHRIDALKEPVAALGYNGTWPGPRISVVEGDKVRAIFKNNLKELTGVHFHGQRLPERDGRRPAHHPGADPAGRVIHVRVRRADARIAHVPLAPQRDRPGRAGTAGRVHRRTARRRPALRPALRRDAGHRLDQQRHARRVHDQRPRVPGDGPDRRPARRDDRHPVHERGQS